MLQYLLAESADRHSRLEARIAEILTAAQDNFRATR